MSKHFYITTTLPYVNAEPHVGFAMEIIRADAVARYKTLQGFDVFFNTGTDEHGQKLLTDATAAGKDVQEYVDHFAKKFRELKELLSITDDVHFIRTTDVHHEVAAQKLWQIVSDNGYIYKKNYEAKYCVGCELEKTDSELVENHCPIHPNKDIEVINEENYFFALSKIAPLLEKLYEEKPNLVIPDFRFNEMKAFLALGLEDFSISRLKSKMSWGVPVPGDDAHVMYVWFDALTNYISTLGWPEDSEQFTKYWVEAQKIQYCGKDNVRQQSMMWQGMLLAANLPTTDSIIINGFINSGGQKMSKSLGNVLRPGEVIDSFVPVAGILAVDVLRYYLLRQVNSFEDSDMTLETVRESYQSGLANGLGNLTSRILTLSEKYCDAWSGLPDTALAALVDSSMNAFDLQRAMQSIWDAIGSLDAVIQQEEPFKVVKVDLGMGKEMIGRHVGALYTIAEALTPFMPTTSAKIIEAIRENKKPETPLFGRLG